VSKTIKLSVVPLVLLAACGDSKSSEPSLVLKPKITISSTTDPTSKLLSEIYGQALEKAEFRVARKKPFDSADSLLAAIASGDVQMSGVTSQTLLTWLRTQSSSSDTVPNATASQEQAITASLPATLKIGAASTAEDKDVVFCAKTYTDANTVATLTDLGPKSATATLAAPDGFDTVTPLGAAGLKDTYGIAFKAVVPTATDKILAAVTAGTADCGVARSADPGFAAGTFTVLQDDKALVPNDVVLPVVTADSGTADVLSVLDSTSTRLTISAMQAMMARLKVDGAPPEVVANEFIGSAGA
jgi:osmoprotectant transport system substrate-binding protein